MKEIHVIDLKLRTKVKEKEEKFQGFPIFRITDSEVESTLNYCVIDKNLSEALRNLYQKMQEDQEYLKAFSFQVKELKEKKAFFENSNILKIIWWKLTWKLKRKRAIKKYEKAKNGKNLSEMQKEETNN